MKSILASFFIFASCYANDPAVLYISPEAYLQSDAPSYFFKIENGSLEKEYVIKTRGLGKQEQVVHDSLKINDQGYLIDPKKNEKYRLIAYRMGPGEPLKISVSSRDDLEVGAIEIIPRPIEATCHGYTLSLQVYDPQMTTYDIHAVGFDPNEMITMISNCGETVSKVHASDAGEVHTSFFPDVDGFKGGYGEIVLRGRKGNISVMYPWGIEYKNNVDWADINPETTHFLN